jgi:hypothetical protein
MHRKTKKWHLSGREAVSQWRHISRNIEGHNIEDKYTALFQNLVEIFFSRLSLCKSTTTG